MSHLESFMTRTDACKDNKNAIGKEYEGGRNLA